MTWPEAIAAHDSRLLEEEKSRHTRRVYREDAALFSTWYRSIFRSEPDPAHVGPTELREWKQSMLAAGHKPASVNRRLCSLRSILVYLAAEGIAEPVKLPRTIAQVIPAPRWLGRPQELSVRRAAERCKHKRNGAVVKFLLATGLRCDELATLTWGAVELSPQGGIATVVGKGRKWRQVPLNADARDALRCLRGKSEPAPGDRLVQGERGSVNAWAIHDIVTKIGAATKPHVPDLTPHVLRHTFCRRLAEMGVRLEQIAALAGHSSLNTTRRYVEPGREELAAAVERLAGE